MKYVSRITLHHTDGETVTIEVTGPSSAKVVHVANTIKKPFGLTLEATTVLESERLWYDFLRDFFRLRKGK